MKKKFVKYIKILSIAPLFFLSGCSKSPEMTLEEIEAYRAGSQNDLIGKTVSRPWKDEGWKNGSVGGIWNTSITGDPKSFNILIAERDAETASILSPLTEALVDYNVVKKKWVPRCASFEIKTDEEKETLDVIYTLRDDLYWSFYNDLKPKVKVTSEDVVFWYKEIMCDEQIGSSSYNSQFMEMPDGSEGLITIEKIDELSFAFHFPRIVAEPLLATNMSFGPAFLYKPAKEKGGAQGIKDLFSVATDPKLIPSMGEYFITEYTPGQRIVYERNPNYWEKDQAGESVNYPQKKIAQIVGDRNTEYLLFKQQKLESYSPTPEQLDDMVSAASNKIDPEGKLLSVKSGFTVFNSAGGMSAPMWTFNQNPKNKDEHFYKWFTKKEFRQAMSCILNRERIISQAYRGLAEPKYSFFPEANTFFNENIVLKYRFSHAHAKKLLESAGFSVRSDGFLYDPDGAKVEFDLTVTSANPVYCDIAQIITDECKKAGITVNVRQTDFQKLVEQLTSTYDWQSMIIGLSGSAIFPTQGSNVWVSSGNLHMWYPLQEKPATDWEARIDFLYNAAKCTIDEEKARGLWNEYQEIILEQCPVIYLVRSRNFFALQNRWDFSNVYFDNMNGAETRHVFLQQ